MVYVLQKRLGRGGMGVVDLAIGPGGQPVAIKRLLLQGSAQEMSMARQRIRREAEALRRLDHPHIVRLLTVHDDGDEVVLVMPYLGGGTLADQVGAHGPLSGDQVRGLVRPMLSALAAAHRQGIVHRDIKPANLLFDLHGRPFLADFGVAILGDATSGLTTAGMMVGTPEFMAPEQARGEPATAASDVFSLGATLAFAATGTPPYGRGDPMVLIQRAAKGRVNQVPTSLPRDVRQVIGPMLERNPRRRPTAAAAAGGAADTTVMPVTTQRSTRRRRASTVMIGATMVMVATVVALFAVITTSARPSQSGPTQTSGPTTVPVPTSPPCKDQRYHPCGGQAAPFTDGEKCVKDRSDYDQDAANGCEAAPDTVDGTDLANVSKPLSANLVPSDDTDSYPFHVGDNWSLVCDGVLKVKLTAPKGASMRLEVLGDDGKKVLDDTTATDGKSGTVTLKEKCGENDTTDLVARVSWIGDRRTAASYQLERSGSF